MYYGSSNSDESRVIEWINNASISVNTAEKIELLHKIQEVVINKSPNLLLRLLSDILTFTTDRDAEARKWLVGFMEEACKKNHQAIETIMPNLHMLLCDESSVQVQKRVIQAAKSIFKNMLIWLSKDSQITESMEQAWNQFSSIKLEILNMIDSDNDGIRTNSVKFLESVVLIQTYPEQGATRNESDFSLEDIPLTLKFARRRKLEEEANHIFTLLIKFHGSAHISSVNLMACMGAVCRIAKARPEFMPRVVIALEQLLSNLPPTLTPSQVSSVKKHMKLQLINILKHPSSYELQHTIIATLNELGVSAQEINRALPKLDEQQRKKYAKRNIETITNQQSPSVPLAKRPRLEMTPESREIIIEDTEKPKEMALKMNEQFIFDNLNNETVTQIVMKTMHSLPNVMPSHFSSNYTPVANPGTSSQLRKLAKLLAVQFTEAGVGPGCSNSNTAATVTASVTVNDNRMDEEIVKEIKKEVIDPEEEKAMNKGKDEEKAIRKPRIKTLRLDQITKPMTLDTRQYLLETSVKRILRAEQAAIKSGASVLRNKIITTLASTFGPSVRETVLAFILEDLKAHIDIALAWLYEEYSYMQGFSRMTNVLRRDGKPNQSYNDLLCAILTNLEGEIKDRDLLLSRIVLEAPLITEEAVDILKRVCIQENRASAIMALLYDLISRRPTKAIIFVHVLLHHTSHENTIVREEATTRVLQLYKRSGKEFQSVIEEQAIVYLDFLTQSQPPPILFGEDVGRPKIIDNWNDETCKACLYLYLALLPIKETLIHELSRIYTQTTADTKRIILRLLEQPVRGMGMDSPELLTLVESCPKGAETLVTRVIHILTDRGPPSAVLVSKVRELYQTRVSDVRFLIPVLNGLTKREIIGALPKLIKLNPVVVKEVFNRLLAGHSDGPITPAELLIALHSIDQSKADLKTVMKATSLCFAEKHIYTQEVLAVVMQQLMDVTPLPTLLMRTVIQSLSLYPRLSGFVMNILQRLILKQVWKQKVVWEGFIKCCQRTKPQSFQVLLQLPTAQLAEALSICPDLQKPLSEHVKSFTESQRAHLPASIMDVLSGKIAATPAVPEVVTPKIESANDVLPNEPLPPGMD